MRFLFAIHQEIKKMLTNYTFILAVIATTVVNMSGTIVTEANTYKSYNLFQIIFMNNTRKNELIDMYNITFSRIFLSGSQGYLWMFISIFASAPFVVLICSAKKNNNIRFEIYRMGKKTYIISKGLASILIGGLVILLGYGIYGLILKLVLPAGETLTLIITIRRLIEMLIYGMSSVIFTFVLSGIMRNRYLVLCIPFMANYFLKSLLEKPNIAESFISRIANPTTPSYLFSYEKTQRIEVICFWIAVILCGFMIYYFVLNRRCDCGE